MAEVCIAIAARIAEYSVAPIGRQLGYFLSYNKKIENLRTEVGRLKSKKNDVDRDINAARMRGEEIKTEVENWQSSVTEIIAKTNDFLENHAQVTRWFHCCSRYRLGREAKGKMEDIITQLQRAEKFDGVSYPPPPPGIESMPGFVLFQSTKLAFNEVMKALKDDAVNIIGIYGMGGAGKTTLVKEIGKQVKRDRVFDMVLMAVVSQTPDLKTIQGQVADMLNLKFDQESVQGRAGRLSGTLNQLSQEKMILVILDDVWERLELTDMGVPPSRKSLKILLTTRREQVCQVMGCHRQILLHILSEDDSLNLFRPIVGDIFDSLTLKGVPREVARECGGLPIALVTVGRALRNNGNLQEWEHALHGLRNAEPINLEGVHEKVYACIKLSYDYLKLKEAKQIFLFCCMFPEDHHINVETLVHYVVGRGLFQRGANSIEETRNSVCTTISQLKASSLLLEIEEATKREGREEYVKMHDVVRDVAIKIASTDESDMFIIKASAGLKQWPNVACENSTVISLMYNEIEELPVDLQCPKLKILSLRGNMKLERIPNMLFEGMSSLEVLDLSSVRTVALGMVGLLKNLQIFIWNLPPVYRSIWTCPNISAFGALRNLQILDLRGHDIRELPKEIGQLNNLRLLDLRHCLIPIGVAPGAVSGLARLEELYIDWDGSLDEKAAAWFDQLKLLSYLKILYVGIINDREVGFSYIRFHLSKFQVSFGNLKSTCIPLMRGTQTPLMDGMNTFLEETKFLHIKHSKFLRNFLIYPKKTSVSLKFLEVLFLTDCMGMEYLINVVEPIEISHISLCPNLNEIHLSRANDLKNICHGPLPATACLWKLRKLEVTSCNKLLDVVSSALLKTLPHLQEIRISKCDALEEIFDLNDHENFCAQEGEAFPPLSSLTTLRLSHLSGLLNIWKGPTQFLRLHNLSEVYVSNCRQIRYLFSHKLASNLLKLEYLTVCYCDELEEIIASNEEEDSMADKIEFPAFSRLVIDRCPNLKIFASGFQSTQNQIKFQRFEDDITEELVLQDPNIIIQSYFNSKKVKGTSECHGTLKLKVVKCIDDDSKEEEEEVSDHQPGNSSDGSSLVPEASIVTAESSEGRGTFED